MKVMFDINVVLDIVANREPFLADALVATSARANGCELIVTRNAKDFAHSPVPVKTPSQFLQKG